MCVSVRRQRRLKRGRHGEGAVKQEIDELPAELRGRRPLREAHAEIDRRQEGFDQQICFDMGRQLAAVSGTTYRGDDPAAR